MKLYTQKQLEKFAFSELKKEYTKVYKQALSFYAKDENETFEDWEKRLKNSLIRDRLDISKIVRAEEKHPIKKMREIYSQESPKTIFKTLCYYAQKKYIKDWERATKGILNALAAELPKDIRIDVSWKKSATWGANPTAEVWADEYLGVSCSVGGCGYDKESTAIAEPFNRSKQMAKIAIIAKFIDAKFKDMSWKEKEEKGIFPYSYGVRFSIFHNNGIYWEGGVGASSFINCIKSAGYKMNAEFHPKYSDCYSLSLNEGK
jgi:hypothetical protein